MKDQYFGDINDYRKYGLIRSLLHAGKLRPLIAWMLTPDDRSTHGEFTEYLSHPERWSRYDRELYLKLQELMGSNAMRAVSLIENTGLLPNAKYFSERVPDFAAERSQWASQLVHSAAKTDLVFLDPDNGLEVKSTPYGRKNSSKFLYWREVEALWGNGKSLLIYQHFRRERRTVFIQRMVLELQHHTPGSMVEAFSTPHVVFLLALQPRHAGYHSELVKDVRRSWDEQIRHWDP